MSLPVSETFLAVGPEKPYYGWGLSNQTATNSIQALNLGPGLTEPNLQSDLYVPDVAPDVSSLETRVEILEDDVVDINNQITTIEGDISTIQGDIVTINQDIVDLGALIIPVSFNNFGSSPNSAGATVASNAITLQPASGTQPGGVSTGSQTFSGDKSFTGTTSLVGITSSGVSTDPGGTQRSLVVNTSTGVIGSVIPPSGGVTTLAPVGAIPNGDGASIFGTTLNLQPANSSNPGVITAVGQTFGGPKTFVDSVTAAGLTTTTSITLPASTTGGNGTINQPAGTRIFHASPSTSIYLGRLAGLLTSTGANCVGIGASALGAITTASSNTAIGGQCMRLQQTGVGNTCVGASIFPVSTISALNTVIGYSAGPNATALTECILIGHHSGPGLTGQTNIIEISDGSIGVSLNRSINIGFATTTSCRIMGIANQTPASPTQMVVIDPTTNKLGGTTYLDQTIVFTPTIDSGVIVSSEMRGTASTTIPMQLTKQGKTVNLLIPSFMLIAQSMAAGSITLTGVSSLPADFRPQYLTNFRIPANNNGLFVDGNISISAGGVVVFQLSGGAFFTLPSGLLYDVGVSWITLA